MEGAVRSEDTKVFPRFLDLPYPNVERGDGVWLTTTDGRRILDACSGGAMVACLGHGVPEVVAAAAGQAEAISYFYNHHFTNEPQERLAGRLLELGDAVQAFTKELEVDAGRLQAVEEVRDGTGLYLMGTKYRCWLRSLRTPQGESKSGTRKSCESKSRIESLHSPPTCVPSARRSRNAPMD